MATLILGGIGAGIGSLFPGGLQLGFSVGAAVGGIIDQSLAAKGHSQSTGRLSDLKISSSQYGALIPQAWGAYRLPVNLIDFTLDANGNFLHESSTKKSSKTTGTTRSYTYTASFACLVCAGPVNRIKRIWAADRLIYNDDATPKTVYLIRTYLGTETQTPDSLLSAYHGATATPAYRGLCYFVAQDLPLADWGNAIPNPLSVEIERFIDYPTLIGSTGGLQLYYRFDASPGPTVDSGPNGATLTTVGSPVSVTGHSNEGVSLPTGSSYFATTGNQPLYEPAQFTAEAWVQWAETSETYGAGAVTWTNPNTGEFAWKLRVSPEAVTLEHLDLQFSINTNANPNVTVFHWNIPFDANWHHWAVTYDTTGNAILYFDGVAQVTVVAPVGTVTITGDPLNRVDITSGSNGQLRWDEVAFYNRLLTPAEVLQHFEGGTTTVGTIAADLFAQEGLVGSQWDVSAATDTVDGFALTDRQTARDALDPLLRVYKTLLAEYDGKIVAVKRGQSAVVTIPATDLGAALWTGTIRPTPPVEVKRLQELELPFRLDLTYLSKFRNYQLATQGAERYTKVGLQDPVTITTPLVLTDDAARQAAEQQLYQMWTEREQFTFSLPLAYLYLAPGDVINLPVLGQTVRARLIQMDAAMPGPIQCTAVLDDAGILVQTVLGAAVTSAGEEATDAASTTLIIWNGNALVDADADSIGLYFVANGSTAGYWPGAQLYWSTDGGVSYQELDVATDGATLGTALTALPVGSLPGVWDTVNTLDVNVTAGAAPETTSDADVIAGSNAALVGREVIQFATVTALGGTQYRLSRLLRGRRGTDGHAGEHVTGERFALLDTGVVKRITLGDTFLGVNVLVKAVTPGETIAGVTAQSVYMGGDEEKEYAPCQLAGGRDGSNNLTITFVARERKSAGLPSPLTIPPDVEFPAYNIYVRSGVLKTVSGISTSSPASVTATAHGFSPGDKILITGVAGMTQMNGLVVTIAGVTTNTFTTTQSSLYWSPWISGGTAEKILRTIVVSAPLAVYSAANQTTDGGVPGNPVSLAVMSVGANGDGFPLLGTV